MKKTVITIFIAIIFGQHAIHAQGPSIGFRGGLNSAKISIADEDFFEPDTRLGYHIGLYLAILVSDKLKFEPGLFYSTKGYQFEESSTDNFNGDISRFEYSVNFNSAYIDVPLIFRFNAVKKLNFYGGTQISFRTSSKIKEKMISCFNGTCETDEYEDSLDDDDIENLDVALVLGIGYDISSRINANIGYDYGIRSIATDSDTNAYNRVFKFSLGYRLK